MFRYCLLFLFPVLFLSFAAHANDPPGLCKKVSWKEGRVYHVHSAIHQYTHIILPDRLLGAPMPGNIDLWETTGAGHHVYIKPTHLAREASTTTLSLVDRANRSYEFVVQRVRGIGDPCVIVKLTGDRVLDPAIGEWRSPGEAAIDNYQATLDNMGVTPDQSAEAALRQYRYHIYTGYSWKAKGGFIGEEFIRDVYDDGRFTHVRVAQDNKGLFSVHAKIDGKDHLIQKTYDSKYHMYKISGIFPEFVLKSDESSIVISRADNATSGGY